MTRLAIAVALIAALATEGAAAKKCKPSSRECKRSRAACVPTNPLLATCTGKPRKCKALAKSDCLKRVKTCLGIAKQQLPCGEALLGLCCGAGGPPAGGDPFATTTTTLSTSTSTTQPGGGGGTVNECSRSSECGPTQCCTRRSRGGQRCCDATPGGADPCDRADFASARDPEPCTDDPSKTCAVCGDERKEIRF
jgi:hypothetical protein